MLICPLITRNTTDITTIQNFLSMLFKLGMMGPLMAIAGVVMCIAYSGRVAVVLAIAVPVMLIILVALLIAASRYSTGAGKTTLINLLMRFYEVNGGNIMIDGVSSTEMTRHELRTHFGMVLQDTWLFEGTIRDNLKYGAQHEVSDEEMIEAAKSVCADSFIRTMPGGYDMMLTKGAENISQGQRQLLTIARAIIADPEIMILDEATSNVDAHTEQAIQNAMAVLMKGRTNFVIAHRLSTIRDADVILYMENGDIKEVGDHDTLMEQNGKYALLYNSQFA